MALDNYSDLQATIQQWMGDRSDLAPFTADFITLAEGEINRDLRSRKQITIATLTLDANSTATLPDDYLAWRNVVALTNPRKRLDEVTPGYRDDAYPFRDAGWPSVFSIDGDSLIVLPATSVGVELEYFAKLAALSSGNPTNWLLSAWPNLYLYGALKHASIFTSDDSRLAKFADAFTNTLQDVIASEREGLWAQGRSRVNSPTP